MTGFSTRDGESQIDAAAVVRRIRFLMETQRVLVQDFAYDIGVKKAYLLEVLDGRTQPTSGFLKSVAAYFGVTVDFLKSGKATNVPPNTAKVDSPKRPARGRRAKKARKLTISELAMRHQALVECLVNKGVITAGEFNACVERVTGRKA